MFINLISKLFRVPNLTIYVLCLTLLYCKSTNVHLTSHLFTRNYSGTKLINNWFSVYGYACYISYVDFENQYFFYGLCLGSLFYKLYAYIHPSISNKNTDYRSLTFIRKIIEKMSVINVTNANNGSYFYGKIFWSRYLMITNFFLK